MFFEQQQFWMSLVNDRPGWEDERVLIETVPAEFRDFGTPPGWPATKALNYLVNNVDALRAAHGALETGRPLDYDLLNNILSEGFLRLVDWGGLPEIRARREARERAGERIDTLQAVSRKAGLNPGTVYIRNTVERAFFYFAQYVDYRFSDDAYPDASPGMFQVKECLWTGCERLFVRTARSLLYCTDDCARSDL